MFRGLGKRFSPENFETEEDRQTAQILIMIISGALVTCLITLLDGWYWHDPSVILMGEMGLILMLVPLGLYLRKQVNAASFFVGFNVLVVVTLAATLGQGSHDISILAYPVILLIGSLIMNRLGIIILSILTALSITWLVFGEASGLYTPHPALGASLPDFLIMASILVVSALIMTLLASNMRNNLRQAHQEIARRKNMEEQLRYLSTHDILTGVYNRLSFESELTRLEGSDRYPVSFIVADLDNLKKTNDSLGHNAGDELLKRASQALQISLRDGDLLARIGGDEFAILLPSADEAYAETILSSIQTRINEVNSTNPEPPVQMSLGTATVQKGEMAKAFSEADRRMYRAKSARKAGKNASQAPMDL